jgi:energy-coupling factor transporter transmembrane protein EcfT
LNVAARLVGDAAYARGYQPEHRQELPARAHNVTLVALTMTAMTAIG